MPSRYSEIEGLELEIERFELHGLSQHTQGGWTRRTTVVRLFGGGCEGAGEDVTYQEEEHESFQRFGKELELAGRYTFAEFSHYVDSLPLWEARPADPKAPLHRIWAFESAALDLALAQARISLADALGHTPSPVRYVVSSGLGDPPNLERLDGIRAMYPGVRLKLDAGHAWTDELVARLADSGTVATVDLKGQYKGPYSGTKPDPELYRRVAEGLADAWLEDPGWTRQTRDVLANHLDRVTYDAPICSLADIVALDRQPRAVNMKPSRFGLVSELLRTYAYCEARGIEMYGGGQFELGPGRGQIQYLASLFHAEGANDVAPTGFNDVEIRPDLPGSPLTPRLAPTGFRWADEDA